MLLFENRWRVREHGTMAVNVLGFALVVTVLREV